MAQSDYTAAERNAIELFLADPSHDRLQELFKALSGEHDNIDYKLEFNPKPVDLVKDVLAFANSGGGILLFGVQQTADKIEAPGLKQFLDKTKLEQDLSNYLPGELVYQVLDFQLPNSADTKLYQCLIVRDRPTKLPFMAMKEGEKLSRTVIYVRRNTSSSPAEYEDTQRILERATAARIAEKPAKEAAQELNELKALYESRKPPISGFTSFETVFRPSLKEYYSFVDELIAEKRKKIRRALL